MLARILAIGILLPLTGCLTLPQSPELPLSALSLQTADGPKPYLSVVGDLPEANWYDKGLPMGRHVWIGKLGGDDLAWLRAFDLDGDEHLVKGEFTQAWLIKTAEIATGDSFVPDSLLAPPLTVATTTNGDAASLIPLKGIEISQAAERQVRAKLDDLAANAGDDALRTQLEAVVETVNESLQQSGEGGDSGDGSSGGSGGGSSGGGASGPGGGMGN